jgi:hypothetical protein
MAKVTRIDAEALREMLAAADELRERIISGEVKSIALLVEIDGRRRPLTVVLGRYESQPRHAAEAIARLHHTLLTRQAVDPAACATR